MRQKAPRQQLAQPVFLTRGQTPVPGASGMSAKRPDGRPQFGHARAGGGLGAHDRRPPLSGAERLQGEVRLDGCHHAIGTVAVGLVDDEDVGNLHDPGLERLDVIAGARHEHDQGDIGGADDVHFVLPHAHGLNDDHRLARRVEHDCCVRGGARQPAKMTARGHAANEHAGIARVRLHPNSVAKHRPAGKRTRGIDSKHSDRLAGRARNCHHPIDQRALPGSGRTGDTHEIGSAGVREELAHQRRGRGTVVFDDRDGTGQRPRVPGQDALAEGHSVGHVSAPEAVARSRGAESRSCLRRWS